MVNAILITIIGMGLVFLALILLWGLMTGMVHFLKDKENKNEDQVEGGDAMVVHPPSPADEETRRKAAAAAVAVAILTQTSKRPQAGTGFFAPPSNQTSAWLLTMRANQIKSKSQRGPSR